MSWPESDILGPGAAHAAADKILAAERRFLYLCGCLLVLALAWSLLTSLDIVSEAVGEVVPRTRVKKIQHLEGGIVREILVREGDRVARDQPLVVLDPAAAEASAEEMEVRLAALEIEALRLEAESKGLSEPAFPQTLLEKRKDLVEQARSLFAARRQRQSADLSAQAERVRQREQDVHENAARLDNLRRNLPLVERQVARNEELFRERLIKEDELIRMRKEENNTKSAIREASAGLARAQAALAGARDELAQAGGRHREEAETELKRVQREHMEFSQRVKRLRDSHERTVLRAAEAGTVKSLAVASAGEVVQPGMTVAEIVPAGDRLVIEAHLPIQDIGYVRPGQAAVVRLASHDARRFGNIRGTVLSVSPDAVTQVLPGGVNTFYRVLVETEADHFSRGANRYELFPGMRVVVGIHIGRRPVLGYFLDPFLESLSGSLHER